ncbi:MAG: hypothetical protein ACFE0I_11265 [Elainellaceae cyanobacterium]
MMRSRIYLELSIQVAVNIEEISIRGTQQFSLSQQEGNWGLLNDVKAIYDCQGWERCLEEHCAELRGQFPLEKLRQRVVWRKDADPYQLKVVRSNIRTRQRE